MIPSKKKKVHQRVHHYTLFSAKVRYDFNLRTAKAEITATKTVTSMTSIPVSQVLPVGNKRRNDESRE